MKKLFIPTLAIITALASCKSSSNNSDFASDDFGDTNVKTEVVYYDNPPAEGFNAEESSPFAVILADQVMNSMGGRKAWDDTNVLYWNFFGARTLLWDKENKHHSEAINTFNIYLPYVNINNYLIDKFEKLEFYHFNTVLINRLVNKNDSDSCYCFIEEGFLKILILKKREILFFNSFSYNSLDDVLYFLILVLQDKSLKNSKLPVKIYSKKDPEEIKNKFKSFLKNITVIHHDGFNQIL